MRLFRHLRQLFQKTGFDLVRFPIPWEGANFEQERKARFLESAGISLVLDVGANCGQYASKLRQYGYTGKIVSFEPLTESFETLSEACSRDPNWTAMPFALGDQAGDSTIYISANSVSSSLMEITDVHMSLEAESRVVGKQTTPVKTLDEIAPSLDLDRHHVLLKMDVQGYESKVLTGAEKSLASIDSVEMELSLIETYRGEMLFRQMWDHMNALGFFLAMIDPAFADPQTGQVVQVNAVFHRKDKSNAGLLR